MSRPVRARAADVCRVVRSVPPPYVRASDVLVQPSIRARTWAQHQFGPGRASSTKRPPGGQG